MNEFQSLDAMKGMQSVPLDMTLEGLQAFQRQRQADDIGLQEMLRKQAFERQADPMRLQQMNTTNEQGLQTLAKAKRENVEADYTSKARMDAELHKHLAETSGADVKMVQDRFQQMAYSPDPKVRQVGITGLQSTKDWMMKKEENDRHLEGIRLQGQAQRDVARINATAKTDAAGMRGSGGKAVDWKNPEAAYAALIHRAVELELAGKDDEASIYRSQANQQLAVMREKWATKGVPEGTIDPSKAGGKERPTVPTVPKADVSRPPTKEQAAKEAPKGPTQADLEFTAKKHGLTVEQVKAKLGIK